MSSEENQSQQPQPQPQNQDSTSTSTYYQRKKNWIGGIDNDTILGGGLALVGIVSAIAAYPVVRDFWNNFTLRVQQQQAINQQNNPYLTVGPNGQPMLPNGEQYIPPTPPNGQGTPPIVESPQQQQQQQPVQEEEEQQQPQEEQETSDDELFHERELKKKQRLMGMKARGRKYESPFGAHIGGLG